MGSRSSGLGAKRVFDAVLTLLTAPVWVPVLLVIALLVRVLQGPPVFFRQTRPGYRGRPFQLVKFRSMSDKRDADGDLLPDSERISSIGRFLRQTSLDELPELFNVLRGEMSLVGPRPLLMEYLDRYTPEQMRRHDVPPGVTGWAQVNGRNALTWDEKFELDTWYVDNHSISLDLRILGRTIGQVLGQGRHQRRRPRHHAQIRGGSVSDAAARYRAMLRIRRFEETILDKFPTGVFHGTTHTYIGQEANAVGILDHIREGDSVFSNHRCHGHFLAYGGDMRGLFAELMGKATGICGGRGGSQHIHWRRFYSNGVLGSAIPVATGMGLAGRLRGDDDIVVVFMGDGAMGEGVIYEALNMAALWRAPVLYVVENNRIAQTTPIELAMAGSIPGRFEGFGIPALAIASSDVDEISSAASKAIAEVRDGGTPQALVIDTNRFAPHSKGDDTRPEEAIEALWATSDPIEIHGFPARSQSA